MNGWNMRSVKLVALIVTAVMALAGCAAEDNPQVAAYVDGSQISQAQVDAVSRVLADTSSDTTDTAGGFSGTVLQIIIQSKVAQAAAAANNIQITQAERDQAVAANDTLATLVKDPAATDFINDYVEATLVVSTDAGKQAFNEQFAKTDVVVNPRFGTWDSQQMALVDGTAGGSISSLAPLKQE